MFFNDHISNIFLFFVLADLQQQQDCKVEEPEPPQVKEEQDLSFSQQLVLDQDTGSFMETCEDRNHSDPEPKIQQLLSHVCPGTERPDYKENNNNVRSSGSRQSRTESAVGEVCWKTFSNKYVLKCCLINTCQKPHVCKLCGNRFRQSPPSAPHGDSLS